MSLAVVHNPDKWAILIDNPRAILYAIDYDRVSGRTKMNKSALVEALGKETNLTKARAEQVVELFFHDMSNALAKGDRVEIRGFCSIFVKAYKGYTGRNPKTGAHTQVPPKKLPFFQCGKELKERVDLT